MNFRGFLVVAIGTFLILMAVKGTYGQVWTLLTGQKASPTTGRSAVGGGGLGPSNLGPGWQT